MYHILIVQYPVMALRITAAAVIILLGVILGHVVDATLPNGLLKTLLLLLIASVDAIIVIRVLLGDKRK